MCATCAAITVKKKRREDVFIILLRHHHTTSFISNIEQNYTTTAIFTKHWDGWKGGGQKNNLIVVHPQYRLIFIVNVK